MINKKNFLGILIIILVFGMQVIGCDEDNGENGTDIKNQLPANDPPASGSALTGTVSIAGTAKVGQTLTANTSSLGGSGTISYQWKRGDTETTVDTNILNATENSYFLTANDVGKYIAVNVTRADNSGNISSNVLGPVADALVFSQITYTTIFGTTNAKGVAFDGSTQWVAVSSGGVLGYSANGETWSRVDLTNLGTDIFGNNPINAVAYGSGKWIVVGGGGKAASSTNGSTWSAVTGGIGGTLNTIAYGNNMWITGGTNGSMYSSTDDNGVTWSSITHPLGTTEIKSIAYGNNRWVAVGANGKMATSTNGTSWSEVNVTDIFTYTYGGSSTVQTIETVAYANNLWIAAGGGGILATSSNGTTWTKVTSNAFSTNSINSIAYGNNKWVAVCGTGYTASRIAVSSDGTNWALVTESIFGNDKINGIAYGNNKWVAVGDKSKIAYASDN